MHGVEDTFQVAACNAAQLTSGVVQTFLAVTGMHAADHPGVTVKSSVTAVPTVASGSCMSDYSHAEWCCALYRSDHKLGMFVLVIHSPDICTQVQGRRSVHRIHVCNVLVSRLHAQALDMHRRVPEG